MRKLVVLFLALILAGPSQSFAQDDQQSLSRITKQIQQVREDEAQLELARNNFNRVLALGGTTFVLSAALLTTMLRAYRIRGEAPSKFMNFLMRQNVRWALMPATGVLAAGSAVVTGMDLANLQDEIDHAQRSLQAEKGDLYELMAARAN